MERRQFIRNTLAIGAVGLLPSVGIATEPDFDGVGFSYVQLGDPSAAMYAEYDGYSKMITVYVQPGATAGQVKQTIDASMVNKGKATT
jgi:hypothetical protein